MDHLKICDTCRESLTFHAQVSPHSAHIQGKGVRYKRWTSFNLQPLERSTQTAKRRGLLMMGVLATILVTAWRSKSEELEIHKDPRGLAPAAIRESRPSLRSPLGQLSSWPRILLVYLPPGVDTVQVTLTQEDQILFQSSLTRDTLGVTFDAVDLGTPKHSLPSLLATLPFPSRPAALRSQAPLDLRVALPSGASDSTRVQLAR